MYLDKQYDCISLHISENTENIEVQKVSFTLTNKNNVGPDFFFFLLCTKRSNHGY